MKTTTEIKGSEEWTLMHAVGAFLLLAGVLALHVFAVTILWRWHVVPLGVKAISPWHALGLLCVVGAFRFTRPQELDGLQWLKANTAGPLILLAIGYLAKEMMP